MYTHQNPAGHALARLSLRRPDRLWVHYCFALGIIFCLFIATHVLSRTIVESGAAAAAEIKNSSTQVMLAQEIVIEAEKLVPQTAPDFNAFNKNILRLEAVHRASFLQNSSLSAAGVTHSDKDDFLYRSVREFIALARAFSASTPASRESANARLYRHYADQGLNDALRQSANLIELQSRAEAQRFDMLQSIFFAASAVVLVAEAIFIFWPAQKLVQSTIQEMREQTSKLRNSKAQLKRMNTQLEHIVNHDQLTGLPNRISLTHYLAKTAVETDDCETGILLVGLDDFKSVNDMFGHDYGDELLIKVSAALQSCVDFENMVAHVGGDEFVLISDEPCAVINRRIFASLHEPFEIKGRRIPINASIGHMKLEATSRQALDIVADAEIALKFAKSAGGNRAQAFTENLRLDMNLMQKMQLELGDAIRNGEIEPWFQPQVRFADGRLHGAEVLARWRHPTRGLINPDVFLPVAERAGLMVDLDHAIWTSAMKYACDWQDNGIWRPSISLNAAPDTLADPYLLERFLLTLQLSGLESDQVIVEVLETTLINGKDDMAAINIDSLAECGIALELDDFGTGYASLSKLTQLPLTGIKLDRSLISPLPDQAADSVVRAILALAVELGLQVVAEGVEESEQADHLNDRGCGIGQGYGFGRPMPPDEFKVWLSVNAKSILHARSDTARSA